MLRQSEAKGPTKSALKKAAKAAEKEKKKGERAALQQDQSNTQANANIASLLVLAKVI